MLRPTDRNDSLRASTEYGVGLAEDLQETRLEVTVEKRLGDDWPVAGLGLRA